MLNAPGRRGGTKTTLLSISLAFFFVFAACGILQGHLPPQERAVHDLVVLHTNDTHGHPVRFFHYPAPDVGGLPARATLIRRIREENRNVLVLDAGDINTGRPESTFFKARPDIEGYNAVGYDAMALGNHEFDNPLQVLKEQMALARFPFLSANVKTHEGRYPARPYVIKAFRGFKVAVFGLTTRETQEVGNPEHIRDLIFEDEISVARRLVPELRKKADLVVALVHMGIYPTSRRGSRRLASEVSGIDLIVDGHTHTRMDTPLQIRHARSDHRTLIVQAWQWGLVLGRVDLRIQDRRITEFRFQTIPINLKRVVRAKDGTRSYPFLKEEIPEDPELLARLKPYVDRVDGLLSKVVGRAQESFFNARVRDRETGLGDLIADAMLWKTEGMGADLAVQNGGGIRADIPEGPITMKSIYEVLPFDNTVVLLTLRGSDLRSLFEHMGTIPRGHGAFPQVSRGTRFTLDPVARECKDVLVRGRPIDPQGTYKVATNSFLAAGGDGYKVFLRAVDTYDTSVFQKDVIIDYIRHLGGVITPRVNGRIRIQGDDRSRIRWRRAA